MTYFSFFLRYRRILGFSVLLALFSSFGQTFLLSLYLREFAEAFTLTEGRIGVLYGIATVLSALLLPWTGQRIDRVSLTGYTLAVTVGMAVAAFAVATAPHWIILFIGLAALRHFGQGLCGHIAMTTAGRSFAENRGKAVAISGTGYPLGEMALPALVTLSIGALGWRLSWGISAGVIACVLAPLAWWLLRSSRRHEDALTPSEGNAGRPASGGAWRSRDLLKDYRFYLILISFVPVGFFSTGFIFYQALIADTRGWGSHVFPLAFAGFAVTRAILALGVGPWIDRLTAVRLLPAHMLCLLLSASTLVFFTPEWAAYLYLVFLGMCMGIGQSVGMAVWAEVYGIENLGAIRSMASMVGVLSTAVAPLLFGLLLDLNLSVQAILIGALCLIAALTLFSFLAASTLDRARRRSAREKAQGGQINYGDRN